MLSAGCQDFFQKFFFFFLHFFLAPTPFSPYRLRMNSMIDAQSDISDLATVAPEEVYGGFHGPEDDAAEDARNWVDDDGPTCDDVAPPDYDGPQDDGHIYPDDGDYDPSSDF